MMRREKAMLINGTLKKIPDNCLIGFDAEWTKNYKIKNGNVPFCFSVVVIKNEALSLAALDKGEVRFSYIQYYCEAPEEFKDLVLLADRWSSEILSALNSSCTLCGHQISSDFSVLYNIGEAYNISPLTYLEKIRGEWKKRKDVSPACIFDTRYDTTKDFLGKSRRLVDMCNDFLLDVTQPELKNQSMTKLQNIFFKTHDKDIFERISVMNLRHSLCAAVLYWLNGKLENAGQRKPVNINRCVYENLSGNFDWIASKDFLVLLNRPCH